MVYVQPAAAPKHHTLVASEQPAETTGRPQVRYSEAGKVPDLKTAHAEDRDGNRSFLMISGGSDAPSAASTLDLD